MYVFKYILYFKVRLYMLDEINYIIYDTLPLDNIFQLLMFLCNIKTDLNYTFYFSQGVLKVNWYPDQKLEIIFLIVFTKTI